MVKLPLALEHALLGFLLQRPMHAYDIHRALTQNHELGLIWRVKQSQLYALLTKLEDEGYIYGTTEPQGNRPPRRMLHLTEAGRQAFTRWIAAPVAHGRDFRQEFLAKLFFANQADDPQVLTTLLQRQRQACQNLLDDLRTQAERAPAPSYDLLVLHFRIGQLEHILRWLDECEAALPPLTP